MAVGSAQEPVSRAGRSAILLLTLANALSFVDRQIISVLVEPIKADLALSDAKIGLLYGASFTLFYIIATLPLAWLTDRTAPSRVAGWCVVAWSGATAVCGSARDLWVIVAARIGVGVGEAGFAPAAMAMLGRTVPAQRLPSAIATVKSGIYVGNALALLIGGGLAALIVPSDSITLPVMGAVRGWQVIFLLLALPGLALGIAILRWRPGKHMQPQPVASLAPLSGHRHWLSRNRSICLYIIAADAMLILGGNSLSFWTPALLQRQLGLDTASVGLYFGLITLVAGGGGVITGGLLADWQGRIRPATGALRVASVGFVAILPLGLAFPLVAHVGAKLALIAAHQGFSGLAIAGGMATLQQIAPPALRGRIAGVYMVAVTIGGMVIGPVLIGHLADHATGPGGETLAVAMASVSSVATLAGLCAVVLAIVRLNAGRTDPAAD